MRQRRTWAIVVIWVVVVIAAVVVAAVFADDDPATDDSSGAGALAFVVGTALTLIYLAVTKPKPVPPPSPLRTCPACSKPMTCDARTCPHCHGESEPWVRHHDMWWYRSPSGWQYLDDADTWRWYATGTPSGTVVADAPPQRALDPTIVPPNA